MSASSIPVPRAYDQVADIGPKVDGIRHAIAANGPIPIPTRKRILRDIYYSFIDNKQLLQDALYKDLHRNGSETELLELGGILGEVKAALDNIDKWTKPEPIDFDIKQFAAAPKLVKEPLGLVLVIGPWNYPLLCTAVPIINAIAAGNALVLKPSEVVPHASEALAQVLETAIPPEFFKVVTGGVAETTELLRHKFDKICFTGSTAVGKIVYRAAAEHLTPCLLELGGKSPVVVDHTANLKLAAKRIVWGKFVNAGQTCIAPDYCLVEESIKDQFVQELKAAVMASYPDLSKDSKDYAHIVSDRLWDRAQTLVTSTSGKVELSWGNPDRESLFFPPTIVSQVGVKDPLMQDELFGPILPIMSVSSAHDAIPLIKNHDMPLAFYIFSNNDGLVQDLTTAIRSGGVLVNDTLVHGASSAIPFGGVGNSGTGAYHGKFGFDEFSHKKPVLKQPEITETFLAMRYPPYTDRKQGLISRLSVPFGVWWPRKGEVRRTWFGRG